MSESDRSEEKLRQASAFLDSIVENLPDMVFVKESNDLRFVLFNRAGEDLLGLPRAELIGKNDFDLFPREQAEFFQAKDREVLRGTTVVIIPEEPIDTPHGRRWLNTKKIPILGPDGEARFLLGISEDITERKQMLDALERAREDLEHRVEERTIELRQANDALQREAEERKHAEAALRTSADQLRQSQKMDAIGRLAGGIAHDFNNLLSVILGYSELLLDEVDGRARTGLIEIGRAGERARSLTQQLLAFSRQQVLSPKVVDINAIIASMSKMLSRVIGEDVELCNLAAPDLYKIRVDPGQIEQVILNLAVNARDAMPRGGLLTIETSNIELDQDFAFARGLAPGPHALLTVTDTGSGMDTNTRARVFEPFFTTKDAGKGTGLGLSTVFGIINQSGGHIAVHGEPGAGARFEIYLPRAEADAVSERSRRELSPQGKETVMLVEDEAQVRAIARTILERQGYRVLDAPSAADAIAMCEAFPGEIDLLVTDVVMPKMGGRELVECLGKSRPGMRVLFMSGYTDDTVVRHGVLEAGVAFLQKPITPDSLARKVREVLDFVS